VLGLAAFGNAHLLGVCTSTSATAANDVTFWMATYHMPNARMGGTLYIEDPAGVVTTSNFGQVCSAGTEDDLSTTAQLAMGFSTHTACNGLSNPTTGTPLWSEQSDLKCYKEIPAQFKPTSNEWMTVQTDASRPGLPGCYKAPIKTWYPATFSGIQAGIYKVWTVDATDLEAHGTNAPCTIGSENNHGGQVFVELAVPDGGAPCATAVPGELLAHADLGNAAACTGGFASGGICEVTCEIGFRKSGALSCMNGLWNPAFQCVRKTHVCAIPTRTGKAEDGVEHVGSMNHVHGDEHGDEAGHDHGLQCDTKVQSLVRNNSIAGVSGVGCSTLTERGTICDLTLTGSDGLPNGYIKAVACTDGLWQSTAETVYKDPNRVQDLDGTDANGNPLGKQYCPVDWKLVDAESAVGQAGRSLANHETCGGNRSDGFLCKTCVRCPLGTMTNGGASPTCHDINHDWIECSHMACSFTHENRHCSKHQSENPLHDLVQGHSFNSTECKSAVATPRLRVYHHAFEAAGTVHKCAMSNSTCRCQCKTVLAPPTPLAVRLGDVSQHRNGEVPPDMDDEMEDTP
jgi:hypothetical protein